MCKYSLFFTELGRGIRLQRLFANLVFVDYFFFELLSEFLWEKLVGWVQ